MTISSILSDSFFDSFSTSILSLDEAQSLPPACYVDEDFFKFEKEAIFYREWLCVGRESWLKQPGDYFTTVHVGEPLIIARNMEGGINAMSSVCQHRGMLVASGQGNTRLFLCPYHHWSYSLDGDLKAAPEMERTCKFEKSKHRLPRLKVETWQGFIFVNFDSDAPPLAPRLAAIDAVVANFRLAELDGPRPEPPARYNWNWKVMLENNNDGYHANRLHRGPLHDMVPSGLASFPELPETSPAYYRFNGSTHPDASFNATQKALLPVFPHLSAEERSRVAFVNLPPSLSLVMNADLILYLILHAEDAGHHSMSMGALVAPGAMNLPMFDGLMKINQIGVQEIVAQDLHVDELVQIGLKSKFAPRGRYSWQEGAQRQLNVWLVDRYRKGWARWKQNGGACLLS